MHNREIGAFVFCELERAFGFVGSPHELLSQWCVVISRVYPVISSNPDTIIPEDGLDASFGDTEVESLIAQSVCDRMDVTKAGHYYCPGKLRSNDPVN